MTQRKRGKGYLCCPGGPLVSAVKEDAGDPGLPLTHGLHVSDILSQLPARLHPLSLPAPGNTCLTQPPRLPDLLSVLV